MNAADPIHHAFPLVADARTRVLVLGSLPGVQSLRLGHYYANPRNQFWQLLSPVTGIDLVALAYPDRLAALCDVGVGLWDVVASARRAGSLDAAIRDVSPRDLRAVAANLPNLRALAFNGATAYRIAQRQWGPDPAFEPRIDLLSLPSSSPAHAVGLAAKQPAWNRMAAYLQ